MPSRPLVPKIGSSEQSTNSIPLFYTPDSVHRFPANQCTAGFALNCLASDLASVIALRGFYLYIPSS